MEIAALNKASSRYPRILPGNFSSFFGADEQKLEAGCVVVSLISMFLGLRYESLSAPAYFQNSFYIIAYITGGAFGLKSSIVSLRQKVVDIDLLMILAALGAALVGAQFEGAMLLFLFSLSNLLQDYALNRSRNAIKSLMKLRPDKAIILRDGKLVSVPVEKVAVDEVFVVRPGDRIPLDGVVAKGESTVDQSSITGESLPVSLTPGCPVFAGTINNNGNLEVRVTKLARESTIERMIHLVEKARAQKAQTQRFLEKTEQRYAFGVIIFTFLAIILPVVIWQEAPEKSFYRAITLMVALSPCALIISTPAVILSAIGNGARRGILFKGGIYVEQAGLVKVVVFDKTGTLTKGKLNVTDVVLLHPEVSPASCWQGDENALLALAASVQIKSEHSLARATVEAAADLDYEFTETLAFQSVAGKGVQARVDDRSIRIGNLRYFDGIHCIGKKEAASHIRKLQAQGKTAVVVAQVSEEQNSAHFLGIIAFADEIRPEAPAVVQRLKKLGVEQVVMLTGDNKQIAQTISAQVGLDRFYAELMPEDKLEIIKELEKKYGATMMIGDGVNDAPSLAAASIGVAMGAAGSDAALEAADVVLMGDQLAHIPYTIALSRKTRKILLMNLSFAFGAILLMIISILSWEMTLPLAVFGHEGGTVLVSLNGLRLLGFKGVEWRTKGC